jgi:tetratricopeptide (TPR) repeat protein
MASGNDRGKAHPLNRGETTIGRGADQDCILADIAVSRHHIIIAVEGPRYRMKDLGSGNGSLVNGVKMDTAILNDGDQIEIGNTLLRLEHAPSRAATAAPGPGGVVRADAGASTMMAEAGQFPQVQQMSRPQPYYPPPQQIAPVPMPMSAETPSDAIKMPPARPVSSVSSLPPPVHTGSHASPGGLLDTPIKKVAVFGTIALVVLLAGAVVLKKVVFNSSQEADKLLKQANKNYNDGDFEAARKLFVEAKDLIDSPKTSEYIKQCDAEIRAKGTLKTARGLVDARRWEEAIKALDKIDQSSAVFEDAQKLRKTAISPAVAADVNDARQAIEDSDFETAQAKVDAALALDPDNDEAQELDKKVRASAGGKEKPGKEARTPREKEPRVASKEKEPREHVQREPREHQVVVREPKQGPPIRPGKSKDDDDDLASVSVSKAEKDVASANSGGADVLGSKTASGPYRAKDFAGSAQALRLQAKSEKGKPFDRDTQLAAQVANLGAIYAKAEADKTKNLPQAVAEYQQALGIDAQIGKGTHGAYFKSQIAKLAKQAAQQAFGAQKWDVAFDNAKAAQRFGGDDGGVQAQLKAKAAEFNTKATGMQKTNLNGAKALWRQVMRMVPASDPNYVKAYQSINAATASHKDDDEE